MSSTRLPNIINLSILPPPPAQVSNFENPTSRADTVHIAAGICLPLVIIFAILRFYAKIKVIKRKTWDDSGTTFICLTIGGGAFGSHAWDVSVGQFTKGQLLLSLLVESLYGPCVWLIKLSLSVPYLEIFGRLRRLKYSAFADIILTGIFYISSMIIFILYCGPKNGQSQFSYLSALASPKCTKTRSLNLAQGIINVISDIYLVILPLPVVWALQMPLRRKMGIAAMISTGFMACMASILGLVYRVIMNRSMDDTWEVIPVWTTTIVEMTAGLLVCCMPAMASVSKLYVSRYRSAVFGSGHCFLLPLKFRSGKSSTPTGSVSELQLTKGGSTHHFRVAAGQHDTYPFQNFRDEHMQEDGFDGASLPLAKNHIQKVTNIHVV